MCHFCLVHFILYGLCFTNILDQKKLWDEQVLCLEEQKFNLEQALLEANKNITHDCKNCEGFQRKNISVCVILVLVSV